MKNELKQLEKEKLFICFMLYSMFGWFYEVFLEVVIYRWGFTNRGVLFGPYCPVYGFGATAFVLILYKYKKKPDKVGIRTVQLWMNRVMKLVTIFLCSMLIATTIELVTSYILEAVTGSWPWQTYKRYAMNFQGRIALSPSVRFGIGGILFLYMMQPIFDKLLEQCSHKTIRRISVGFGGMVAVDFVCTMFVRLG